MRLRPTWVQVDLDAIRHNVRTLKPEDAELMAVVKANAYGHGDVAGRARRAGGRRHLARCRPRRGGSGPAGGGHRVAHPGPLGVPCGSERDALACRAHADACTPTTASPGWPRPPAGRDGRRARQGRHRHAPRRRVAARRQPSRSSSGSLGRVRAGGPVDALRQLRRGRGDHARAARPVPVGGRGCSGSGPRPRLLHAANTGATILSSRGHLDLVRPGIAIYGVEPAPGVGADLGLRPRSPGVRR